jgi:UDP-N-acetylglucosamine:LPS N-acetylglucosamine transferase
MVKSKKPIKIGLITSSGGHLFKLYQLKSWWNKYPHFFVTQNDPFANNLLKNHKIYHANFPENRNITNFFKNLILAYKILSKEKPQLLFSTGAGIAPPFFIIAKLLGIKTIFMETFILIPKPTLSGKILYHLTNYFLVQNKQLLKTYPQARFWGSCL